MQRQKFFCRLMQPKPTVVLAGQSLREPLRRRASSSALYFAGKFLRTSFCKSSENETCFILMPAPSKVRFFRKSECGPTQPAPRLLSFHEEKPHLCFLRCHTFLCAVPRMGKAHSPNFLQEPCGLTQPAPEVPFLSKRKEPKIRQRGGILFGNTSEGQDHTSTFCVALLFCVRSREWTKSILRTFA